MSLLAFSVSASAFEVPREAQAWKRQYLVAARQVWGLELPAWQAAQLGQESGFRDGLTSSAGARGLCQFIGPTAAGIERQYSGLASWGRYSPRWCFFAMSLLNRDLLQEFGRERDKCQGAKFTLAGYNGSPTTLRKEAALCAADFPRCDSRLWDENVAIKTARAAHHWRESRTYVTRIMRNEQAYADQGWGVIYCPRR